MIYSTKNILLSANLALAEHLLASGYNVHWYAANETQNQSVLGTARGTVTVVPWAPANPVHLVVLTQGSIVSNSDVAVPAFAIWVSPPRRIARLGLGDPRWVRHRQWVINGFAKSEEEQRFLADLFDEWLTIEDPNKPILPVWDYDTDGANPPELDPAELEQCVVSSRENPTTDEAIRYNLQVSAIISYVE